MVYLGWWVCWVCWLGYWFETAGPVIGDAHERDGENSVDAMRDLLLLLLLYTAGICNAVW